MFFVSAVVPVHRFIGACGGRVDDPSNALVQFIALGCLHRVMGFAWGSSNQDLVIASSLPSPVLHKLTPAKHSLSWHWPIL